MYQITRSSIYAFLLDQVGVLEPGEAYLATRGKHFTCEPNSFTNAVYRVAEQNGYKATCAVFTREVVYAFYRSSDLMRPNLPAYPIVKKMRRYQ